MDWLLQSAVQVRPPLTVFFVLLLVVGLSVAVFWLLVQRWTAQRQRAAMGEWARANGFELRWEPTVEVPEPVRDVVGNEAHVDITLIDREQRRILVRLHTNSTPSPRAPQRPASWHLLIFPIASAWPTTALRPASHPQSIVDLFEVSSYPSLIPPQRFVVFGTSGRAARALAESSVRALLPADVGVVLHESWLVLDFSTRPFDTIELSRMLEVAEQLKRHVILETR